MSENSYFYKRLGIFVLFALPITYIGIILAVGIHEVIGHGLTTIALGGKFISFNLQVDGMGVAYTNWNTLSEMSRAIALFGGAFFTTFFGILFIVLAAVFRKKIFTSLTFLVLSVLCILDGAPYFFWDGLYLGGIGDVSQIVELFPSTKVPLIIFGLITMLLGIVYFNILMFKMGNILLGKGKPLDLHEKVVFSLVLLIFQAGGWFIFDWNQLIPGVNLWPSIVGIIITLITLGFLMFYPLEESSIEDNNLKWKLATTSAWIACLIVVFLVIFIFQKGVTL